MEGKKKCLHVKGSDGASGMYICLKCGIGMEGEEYDTEYDFLKKQKAEIESRADATVALLDDIISWEKDLSEYKSLEGILRSKYRITKR